MSNFLPLVEATFDFDGDTVAVSFERLSRQQMMEIAPFMPTNKDQVQTLEQQMIMGDKAINILKTNMKTFSGLKDKNSQEIPFEKAVDQAYFTHLFGQIASRLISESIVVEKKQKTLNETPTKS